MRIFMYKLLPILVALSLSACGNAEEDALSMMESIAKTAEAHRGNCDLQALELGKLLGANGSRIEKLSSIRTDKSQKERSALEEKFGPRRALVTVRTINALAGCADHPALAKALQGL